MLHYRYTMSFEVWFRHCRHDHIAYSWWFQINFTGLICVTAVIRGQFHKGTPENKPSLDVKSDFLRVKIDHSAIWRCLRAFCKTEWVSWEMEISRLLVERNMPAFTGNPLNFSERTLLKCFTLLGFTDLN